MALPRADELSRWTVQQVTSWLQEMSLTNFRENFLLDGIDGSKLMKMQPNEIDSRYPHVPVKKRAFLKDILSKIEQTAPQVAHWKTGPLLPPRQTRAPPPLPANDSDSSDADDWGSDFEGDEGGGDYIEPTSHIKQGPLPNSDHRHLKPVPTTPRLPHPEEPQEVYEVIEDSAPEAPPSKRGGGLERRQTIIDKLKSALNQRQQEIADNESNSDSDGESYIEPVSGPTHDDVNEAPPPPRPPRRGLPLEPTPSSKKEPDRLGPSPVPPGYRPPPPLPEPKEPEDVYEVMEEDKNLQADALNADDDDYMQPDPAKVEKSGGYLDFSGSSRVTPTSQKTHTPKPSGAFTEAPPPPRPGPHKKVHTGTPPQQDNNQQAKENMVEGDLSRHPWFHGKIGRKEANIILEQYRQDGMYLIRESERSADQPFTLALWYAERSWNLPIRRRPDQHYAAGSEKPNETSFGTITELVEYYKHTTLALKGTKGPQLLHPAPAH